MVQCICQLFDWWCQICGSSPWFLLEEKQPTNTAHRIMILLMDEILHQLIWSISHSLQGFMHPQVVVWDFFHQEYVYVQYEKKHLFSNWFILPQQRVLLAVSRNSGPRMVGLQGRPMEDEAKGSCGTIHHSKYMNFSDLFFLSSKNHHGWNIQRDKTYYIYICWCFNIKWLGFKHVVLPCLFKNISRTISG